MSKVSFQSCRDRSVLRPTYIYRLGNFDASGVFAGEKIEWSRGMAPFELDAIELANPRTLVTEAIEHHHRRAKLDYLLTIKADDRRQLEHIVGTCEGCAA
jgi:hypothetical protein